MKTIGVSEFMSCFLLETLTFGSSVVSIGLSAFQLCSSLKTITFWNIVETIGNSVFHLCSSLKTLTFWNSVRIIGSNAFRDCKNMSRIYFYGEISPIIDTTSFLNVPITTIMTLKSYQNETFGEFNISNGETIEGCFLWPTFTFTLSDTFSNILTEITVRSLYSF